MIIGHQPQPQIAKHGQGGLNLINLIGSVNHYQPLSHAIHRGQPWPNVATHDQTRPRNINPHRSVDTIDPVVGWAQGLPDNSNSTAKQEPSSSQQLMVTHGHTLSNPISIVNLYQRLSHVIHRG